MRQLALVCVGGAFGSGARYLVAVGAARWIGVELPYGTLAVNLVGSFLIGLVQQLAALSVLSDNNRLLLGTGVMGSWLASVARNAGRTLAEKRNASAQPGGQAPATAPPAVVMQGAPMLQGPSLFPEPGLSGPMREVLLTPEPMAEGQDELGRMRPRKVRRIVRRMERREDRREQREEPEPEPEEEVLQGDELGRGGRRRRRGGGGGGKKGGGGQGRGRFTRSKKDDQDEDDSDDS
jgi:hypothetical protein